MGKAFAQNAPGRSYTARNRLCAHAYINFLLPAWVLYLMGAVGKFASRFCPSLSWDVSQAM